MSSFFGISIGDKGEGHSSNGNRDDSKSSSSNKNGASTGETGDIDAIMGTIPKTETLSQPQTMLSKARSFFDEQRKTLAPWNEFTAAPSNPKTMSEATKRVTHNVTKFRSNYILVTLTLAAYALITSPLLLISILLIYAGVMFASHRAEAGPVILFGKEYTAQDLKRATIILAVPLLYLASATSTLFWLIGASLVVVLAHASAIAVPTSEQLQESA